MKILKSQLQKIIKEEYERIVAEAVAINPDDRYTLQKHMTKGDYFKITANEIMVSSTSRAQRLIQPEMPLKIVKGALIGIGASASEEDKYFSKEFGFNYENDVPYVKLVNNDMLYYIKIGDGNITKIEKLLTGKVKTDKAMVTIYPEST